MLLENLIESPALCQGHFRSSASGPGVGGWGRADWLAGEELDLTAVKFELRTVVDVRQPGRNKAETKSLYCSVSVRLALTENNSMPNENGRY